MKPRPAPPLDRKPLSRQVADLIREMIRTGELTDPLPGEIPFAAKIGVSRPVLRGALQELAAERLIATTNGKRTRILRKRSAAVRPRRPRILVLSPLRSEVPHQLANVVVEEIRHRLEAEGYQWNALTDARLRARDAGPMLDSLVPIGAYDCLLLLGSTESMQRWAARNRTPALVLGSSFPGIDLPSVDTDYRALGWHAAGQLAAAGHTRIAVLFRNPMRQGDKATIEGLQAYRNRHLDPARSFSLTALAGGVEETCTQIERLVRREGKPDALILFQPADAVIALTHFLRTGRRIPDDIALLSRESVPLMAAMVPNLTRYGSNEEQLIRQTVRAIQKLDTRHIRSTLKIRIPPRFIRGNTVKPHAELPKTQKHPG